MAARSSWQGTFKFAKVITGDFTPMKSTQERKFLNIKKNLITLQFLSNQELSTSLVPFCFILLQRKILHKIFEHIDFIFEILWRLWEATWNSQTKSHTVTKFTTARFRSNYERNLILAWNSSVENGLHFNMDTQTLQFHPDPREPVFIRTKAKYCRNDLDRHPVLGLHPCTQLSHSRTGQTTHGRRIHTERAHANVNTKAILQTTVSNYDSIHVANIWNTIVTFPSIPTLFSMSN